MKNATETEKLKQLFLLLGSKPADIVGLAKQIDQLTEAMTDKINDDTFNRLSDIMEDLNHSCSKQIKLIHMAKQLLGLEIVEN